MDASVTFGDGILNLYSATKDLNDRCIFRVAANALKADIVVSYSIGFVYHAKTSRENLNIVR